jgi:hypothetical protein
MGGDNFSRASADALQDGMAEPAMCGKECRQPAEDLGPPSLRLVSRSERGGWNLFVRLLLWATRNAGRQD